jgi:3-methyladenine DNA glycosylase AlkD
MTAAQVMATLKKMGTAQNRKVYARHGATGDMFGVSFGNLRMLRKQIKTDQALAEALWDTENTDARMLAVMIADPDAFSKSNLDNWMRQIDYYTLADIYVKEVVCRSRHVYSRLEKWIDRKHEWIGRAGWVVLANMAMDPENDLTSSELSGYLNRIEKSIHEAPNLTRDAMNSALISIGIRNGKFRKEATKVARKVGEVAVDHGETGCKTPDAVGYIEKTWARREK